MSLFDNLPLQLVAEILSYLPFEERERVRRVSQRFALANDVVTRAPYTAKRSELAGLTRAPEDTGQLVRASRGIRGLEHNGSMTTARSLLLDRFLRLPNYDLHWGSDNYMTMLALTPGDLASMRGQRLLDVGSGLGIFGAEVVVLYGIQVDRVDLNAGVFRRVDYEAVAIAYLEGVAVLEYARERFPGTMSTLVGPHVETFLPAVLANLGKISRQYLASMTTTPIVNDSVASMTRIRSDDYDMVVSLVLFMYLPAEIQAQGLSELVRVTKVGGSIRILPGNTLARRNKMTQRFVEEKARWGNKAVTIERFEPDRLMILRVVDSSRSNCILM